MEAIFAYSAQSIEQAPEVNSEIEVGNDRFKILGLKEYRAEHLELLINELLSLIEKNQSDTIPFVIFDDFNSFRASIKFLELLQESNINFRFYNLASINRETISPIIDALRFTQQKRSEKIKKGLKKRRAEGKTLGNPDMGRKKGKPNRMLRLNSLINPANLEASKIIKNKREQGWSYGQIADYLNSIDLTTVRGAAFRAKSVQRLYQRIMELKESFKDSNGESNIKKFFQPGYQLEYMDDEDGFKQQDKLEITGLEKDANFDTKIEFEIKSALNDDFQVVIKDNDQEDDLPVYKKRFTKDQTHVTIDLDKHALLPGAHYISIATKDKRYEPFLNLRINLRKAILELIG